MHPIRVVLPESNSKQDSKTRVQRKETLYLRNLRLEVSAKEAEIESLLDDARITATSFVIRDVKEYLSRKTKPTLERIAKDLVIDKKIIKKALLLLIKLKEVRAKRGSRFVTFELR
jgi:hypothetical protein